MIFLQNVKSELFKFELTIQAFLSITFVRAAKSQINTLGLSQDFS